ncbi:MAG: hypothetical protein IK055_08225 [Lachnospiraceae bacterium]|nr:hypothetical protein [Lachnospiraceae bacterium]
MGKTIDPTGYGEIGDIGQPDVMCVSEITEYDSYEAKVVNNYKSPRFDQ